MKQSEHLRPEIQFGYRNQLLTPEELRIADAHMSGCDACRDALACGMDADSLAESLRRTLETPPASRGRRLMPYAAAAAIVVAAASAAIWFGMHRGESKPAAARNEKLEMDAVLQSGRLPLADFVKELRPPRELLMGESSGRQELRILAPVATAILSTRPLFRWKPLPGDWIYVVRVFRPGAMLAVSSGEIRGGEWTPQADLERGITYQWQIVARHGQELITQPLPPQLPPRFRVLDAAAAEAIQKVVASSSGQHVLLAIQYGKAGLVEDARHELEEAQRGNPNSPQIRGLLASLSAE